MDLCPIIYIVSKICVGRKLWHMKSGELCCAVLMCEYAKRGAALEKQQHGI